MATRQIKWNSLFNLSELDFMPDGPSVIEISDELLQTISWLTGATRHDRRLLRCNEVGALLVGNSWDILESIATDVIYPDTDTPDSYTGIPDNKGVLISNGALMVKLDFVRYSGEAAKTVYVPANTFYFRPYRTYSITATTVPSSGGTASYVGVTVFN